MPFLNAYLSWKTSHLASILPKQKPCHYDIHSPPSKPGFLAHLWVWGCGIRADLGVLRDQGQICLHRRMYLREHNIQWDLENKIIMFISRSNWILDNTNLYPRAELFACIKCLCPVELHGSIFFPSTTVASVIVSRALVQADQAVIPDVLCQALLSSLWQSSVVLGVWKSLWCVPEDQSFPITPACPSSPFSVSKENSLWWEFRFSAFLQRH